MINIQSVSSQGPEFFSVSRLANSQRVLRIRRATSVGELREAAQLVEKMYQARGYESSNGDLRVDPGFTLTAWIDDELAGTLSVRYDSERGLAADQLYSDEVDGLRRAGWRVCEFTRLATDPCCDSSETVRGLIGYAYFIAHRVNNFSEVVIEVNPRHVAFYKRRMGGVVLGPVRICPRVNAPSVLLHTNMASSEPLVMRFGRIEGLLPEASEHQDLQVRFPLGGLPRHSVSYAAQRQ
jgi:hypothetical protein